MHNHRKNPYVAAGLTAFAVIAGALLLFFFLFHAKEVLSFLGMIGQILRPIFMGAVIAFLLLPVHRRILSFLLSMTPDKRLEDKRSLKFLNFLAILFSLLLAIFVLYILLAMVIPQVWQSIVDLVNAIPGYIEQAQGWLRTFLEDNPEIQGAVLSGYESAALSLEQWLNSDILPNLQSVSATLDWMHKEVLPNITGVVSGVSAILLATLLLVKDLLIAIIVSVYLLAMKDTFSAQSKKIVYSVFRTDIADLIVEETRNAYRIMSGFINGKIVDSLIIGIICLVCCNIFKFPYPALLATIVGVTNVIPFFGPFIGAIPCILLIFIIDPIQSVYFALFILVLQQFDGNILGPKILGDSTGLASFWVLFSILLFGGLFGFGGMVLGVPVFAMFYSAVSRLVRYGLGKRKLPQNTQDYLGKTGPLRKDPLPMKEEE
ncbi:AI-2E family transporter [Lawsonibacter sp. LCP25S3_G6]|uniref:AI-2E family transporter n=1 Tax=unclassified Lawsonibacter TaxID=2617946 RepID=UPI003F9439A8